MKKKIIAIILAAGAGKRFGGKIPKQFLKLSGKNILLYSMEVFEKSREISGIVIVTGKDRINTVLELAKRNSIKKVISVIPGGATRQASSFCGVKNCPPGTEYVVIHDAARPFVTKNMIRNVLAGALRAGAATAAACVSDTVFMVEKGTVRSVLDRYALRGAQTPQAFKYTLIRKAHTMAAKKGKKDATDDCSLVLAMGKPVRIVDSPADNIKITSPRDMIFAACLAAKKGGKA